MAEERQEEQPQTGPNGRSLLHLRCSHPWSLSDFTLCDGTFVLGFFFHLSIRSLVIYLLFIHSLFTLCRGAWKVWRVFIVELVKCIMERCVVEMMKKMGGSRGEQMMKELINLKGKKKKIIMMANTRTGAGFRRDRDVSDLREVHETVVGEGAAVQGPGRGRLQTQHLQPVCATDLFYILCYILT